MDEHDYEREHAIAELIRDGWTTDQAHQILNLDPSPQPPAKGPSKR